MSHNFCDLAQLRIWSENELNTRDHAQTHLTQVVPKALSKINAAWKFTRVEAPCVLPRDMLSDAYTSDDIWLTQVTRAERLFALRSETTPSTYAAIHALHPRLSIKPPHAFWQVGKSWRQEPPSKSSRLRFFEFTQLEFQCLYSPETKVDYRERMMPTLERELSWLCRAEARVIPSDRIPSYALSTLDVEVKHKKEWREVASVSIRTDFDPSLLNLEIAIGLDRIAVIANS